MIQNKANIPNSQAEPQSLEAPEELILKLLPTLDNKQLARVVNGIADVVLTSEILN
jgi:hypothetical protein